MHYPFGPIIMIIAMSMTLAIPVIAIVMHYTNRNQREKLWHETARVALEKGQPVPPRPLTDEDIRNQPPPGVNPEQWWRERRARKREKDLTGGFVLLGLGIAMVVAGHTRFGHGDMVFPGCILVGLGGAMLAGRFFSGDDPSGRPPQA
jgi:hypothetical protein